MELLWTQRKYNAIIFTYHMFIVQLLTRPIDFTAFIDRWQRTIRQLRKESAGRMCAVQAQHSSKHCVSPHLFWIPIKPNPRPTTVRQITGESTVVCRDKILCRTNRGDPSFRATALRTPEFQQPQLHFSLHLLAVATSCGNGKKGNTRKTDLRKKIRLTILK